MTSKRPSTYWSEAIEAGDERRKQQQLEIARNLIVAGLVVAMKAHGSGLQAIAEGETAVSGWLAAHNAELTAEVEALETRGNA
ncbi:hypothetical protein FKO01_04980 [Mesorhizobium sp. B2-3-3]|nr:hypothetical protein FKO01_04980 [Mesorhizobium sp. B2-3-3]